VEVSERTREAEAKKATPLRRVANCMFAVATNCSEENQVSDVNHNRAKRCRGSKRLRVVVVCLRLNGEEVERKNAFYVQK